MSKEELSGKMNTKRDWTQEETFAFYNLLDSIPEYTNMAPANDYKNNEISLTASHRNNGRVMITIKDAKYGNVASHEFGEPPSTNEIIHIISGLKSKISANGEKSQRWNEVDAALECE